MGKTFKEKLDSEEKKWWIITFLTALLGLVSLVLVCVFFPNVIKPLSSILVMLFCFNFGVTIGIMYANKILQKKTEKEIKLTRFEKVRLLFAYVTIGGFFLFLQKLDKIISICLCSDKEEK